MATKRSAGRASANLARSVDRDGVVTVDLRQGGRETWIWILGLAALGALVGLSLGIRSWLGTTPAAGGHRPGGDELRSGTPVSGRARAPRNAVPGAPGRPGEARSPTGLTPPAALGSPAEPTGLTPSFEPEVAGASNAGVPEGQERTGIHLFPAHGTKPIKPGIIVPEDFPLPPGYVRHFQATDKGQMLEAILTFHPDYTPLDAEGNPVPLPPDRVVPPEMAPPGLPIKILEVPAEDLDEEGEADTEPGGADTTP